MKDKTEGVAKLWEQYKYALLVVLAGMLLMMWPVGRKAPEKQEPPNTDALQQRLSEALGQMDGVGQVQVVLTLDSDGERLLAQDTETRYRGDAASPEDYQRTAEIVLTDGGSGDVPTVVRTLYPTYRGALVVCQGGDDAGVRLAVTQAVQALTGLSSDRISVAKWQ